MKYQVLKNCVFSGGRAKVGEVIEVGDKEATELMGIGRITPHHEPVVENRSVGLEESTEAPKKRGKSKKING